MRHFIERLSSIISGRQASLPISVNVTASLPTKPMVTHDWLGQLVSPNRIVVGGCARPRHGCRSCHTVSPAHATSCTLACACCGRSSWCTVAKAARLAQRVVSSSRAVLSHQCTPWPSLPAFARHGRRSHHPVSHATAALLARAPCSRCLVAPAHAVAAAACHGRRSHPRAQAGAQEGVKLARP